MRLIYACLLLFIGANITLAAPIDHTATLSRIGETNIISSSDVFIESKRIEADVLAIMKHRHIQSNNTSTAVQVSFKARHVWQKTYEILVKINIYRRSEHYPIISVSTLEPTQNLHPKMVYDQTQRILTELSLIKVRLNIDRSFAAPLASKHSSRNKTANDVYILLTKISNDLDQLIGYGFTPSDVFAQAIRINTDIETILHALNISDESYPPVKPINHTPRKSFLAAMQLAKTVAKLQRLLSIPITDFSNFTHKNITPSHVFELVGLISAELQPIKFALSLNHASTPAAKYYEGKTPADVEQLLIWCNSKLKQVHSVRL